jgi:CelD/BcsL family acetyltransferase involved in cellulose biosynthesis
LTAPRRTELTGPAALEDMGAALDELLATAGAPVTARRPWLSAWTATFRERDPWLVCLYEDERLDGVALLARVRRGGTWRVTGLGHGASDHSMCFPVRSPAAAEPLAAAVDDAVGGLSGPWSFMAEQQPADDLVVHALARRWRTTTLVPGDGCPVLYLDRGERNMYSSKKTRRDLKEARWRLEEAGLESSVECISGAAVRDALPLVMTLHRERDHALGRRSDLDDPDYRAFYEAVVRSCSERDEMEVVLVRIGDRPAAFELAIIDSGAYRLWDGRIATEFAHFGPGHLAREAVLDRVLADLRFTEVDWMRGAQQYKRHLSREIVPTVELRAWSSPAARVVLDLPRRARGVFARIRSEHPVFQRMWSAVKKRTVLRRSRRAS